MDIINSLKWRYATKKFNFKKKISKDKLNILKEAFNLTATSYGLQPIKLVVIEDKVIREQLVEYSFGQRQVVDSSYLLIICKENEVGDVYVREYFARENKIRNTPEEVIKDFRETTAATFENKNDKDTAEWAIKNAYIALGNLLTVCALEKIDACPMEGFLPKKYDELLNLNELGISSVVLLPVGYRAEDDMFSNLNKIRKPLDSIVIEK